MKEIAVFGGTFDPPTRAHEGIVAACLAQPGIDEVWLMPSGCRADKPGMSANDARLAMLDLMRDEVFGGDERLVVSNFEQRLPQPTKTYLTVRALEEANPNDRFWYVYGADAYHDMPAWERGADLRQKIGMLLVPRGDLVLPAETGRLQHLPVQESVLGISSTEFRESLRSRGGADSLVCRAVASYIREQTMYAADTV